MCLLRYYVVHDTEMRVQFTFFDVQLFLKLLHLKILDWVPSCSALFIQNGFLFLKGRWCQMSLSEQIVFRLACSVCVWGRCYRCFIGQRRISFNISAAMFNPVSWCFFCVPNPWIKRLNILEAIWYIRRALAVDPNSDPPFVDEQEMMNLAGSHAFYISVS